MIYPTSEIPEDQSKILFTPGANVGLCFSGGGPRSFCATLGYLRALHQTGFMQKVKYISGVSGSTWALVPYIFYPEAGDLKKFLGTDHFGKEGCLGLQDFRYTDLGYLGNSIISLAYNTQLIEYIYDSLFYLSEAEKSRIWAYMLGKMFLQPYGLMCDSMIAPSREFIDTFGEGVPGPFIFPRVGTPLLMTNMDVVKTKDRGTLKNTDFDLIISSPLATGTLSDIGGGYGKGYMSTWGFHPLKYYPEDRKVEVGVKDQRFQLFDMMGGSSTAYGIITEYLRLDLSLLNPSYRIPNYEDESKENLKYFDCVDGGVLDNTGILPLLQRGIEEIYMFANSCVPLNDGGPPDISIRQLFLGYTEEKFCRYFKFISDLKVFGDGEARWKELMDGLHNPANNGIVELKDVQVLANDGLQIGEYILRKLVVIYLYPSEGWLNQRVDEDVRELLKTKEYHNFPYFSTVFENDGWIEKELLAWTDVQANMVADLAWYNLMHYIA